jgi:hypothetical protein
MASDSKLAIASRLLAAPKSKIQFNGAGALRTYISLAHSAFWCKAGIWRMSVLNDLG